MLDLMKSKFEKTLKEHYITGGAAFGDKILINYFFQTLIFWKIKCPMNTVRIPKDTSENDFIRCIRKKFKCILDE